MNPSTTRSLLAGPLQPLELVSALVDGQLDAQQSGQAIGLVLGDDACRQAWVHYHLAGELMRSSDAPLPVGSQQGSALLARVMQRIAQEPAPAQPQAGALLLRNPQAAHAANDPWAWKLVAGFASMAAVAAVAWNGLVPGLHNPQPAALVATAQTAAVQTAAPPAPLLERAQGERADATLVRDPRLDAFLAAHRQFGGTSALQAPAGFLRDATFEVPKR